MLYFVTVFEILMAILGIVILVAGKIPRWLMPGLRHRYDGPGIRWFGVLLLLPMPLAFLIGVVFYLVSGTTPPPWAALIESGITVVVLIAALLVERRFRKPLRPPTDRQRERKSYDAP